MTRNAGSSPDKRYERVVDTNTPMDLASLASFRSLEEWLPRAKELREQILCAAGLVPMPKKTPLKAKVFGRIDRGEYTVEKVYLQSMPGLFVAGNLYRPKGKGPFPAALNVHGHWQTGRFENTDRSSNPGRCISFARQGYVALFIDMIGGGYVELVVSWVSYQGAPGIDVARRGIAHPRHDRWR